MPPEASSRSRTYFPKSWGNTRRLHASALGLTWACSACTTVPGEDEIHQIRAHWLPSCPPPAGDDLAEIDLEALGDFDPSPETREVLGEGDGTAMVVVPAATRAVTARATDGSRTWTGFGTIDAGGDADFALFPRGEACRVAGGEGAAYPAAGSAGGEALGYHAGARTVLVAGGNGPSSVATGALAFDIATGEVTVVEPEDGLRARRALSRITPFGDGLLVSGGLDPAGAPLGTADIFDPVTRAFEEELVELESARGRHAAVELASGETLLVGGIGPLGEALGTLEALSPETRRYRISGLTDLATARLDPVVLRLDDDHILVAGGTDAALAPIDSVEWLEPDASSAARDALLLASPGAPTLGRAFVAMPGGSALAVGGCILAVGPPACDAPCARGRGCPSSEVLWLTREGQVGKLPDLDRPLAEPHLVGAEHGRPFLLVQTPSGGAMRRFDPWLGRFVLPDGEAPVPPSGARFLATDPGLFLWLEPGDAGTSLQAFRHGTRNGFSALVAPLLLGSTAGIAPDRAPGTGVALDLSPNGGGAVLSEPGASVLVTDTTYADVFLTLDLNLEVEGNVLPVVWLGTRGFGGTACPWPGAGDAARVERRGGIVSLHVGEGVRECEGPSGRVDVRLEAPDRAVHVRSVTVRRSPGE